METTFKLRLADAPGRAFKPIDGKVAASGYHLAYATRGMLEAPEGTLHEQAFDGWQFFLRLYTINNASKQRLVLVLDEPQVVFLYQLAGASSLMGEDSYRAAYLPKGIHPLDVNKGTHEVLVFGFPYGYLVWLTRQHPELQQLAASWKMNAANPAYLPKVAIQQEEKRTVQRLVKCPKRGNELDGALKVYLARLIALYSAHLAPNAPAGLAMCETLKLIDAFVEIHFADRKEVSIAALSERFGRSPRSIQYGYRSTYSCTISDRLSQFRIREAKHLLAHTDMALEAIAEQSGFNHAESLRQAFRKCEGQTPIAYRDQHRERPKDRANKAEKKLRDCTSAGEQPIGSAVPL